MSAPVAPAVDALVVAWLASKVDPPVATKVPQTRPSSFVRVLLTGGPGRSQVVIHRATVVVEAWGSTTSEAASLARELDVAMYEAELAGQWYSTSPLSAIGYLPDPKSGQERYTATYEVAVRAV